VPLRARDFVIPYIGAGAGRLKERAADNSWILRRPLNQY
jgi:hypothetical protein